MPCSDPRAACALTAGLLLCAPVAAQGTMDVARHFTLFDEICPTALAGIEPLKDTLPMPGPLGKQVFATSSDGNLITFQTGRDDFLIIGTLRYGPGFFVRDCMVQQITSDAPPVEALQAAFEAHRPTGAGIISTGGRVAEDIPPVGSFAMAPNMPLTDRRDYMIQGALSDGALMFVSFGLGNFRISSVAIEPR